MTGRQFNQLKVGGYVKANITYSGTIRKGEKYRIEQIDPTTIWIICDDGYRRNGLECFDACVAKVNKLTKTL